MGGCNLAWPELLCCAVLRCAVQTRPFVVAQEYVDNPLLIDNHKFGIRVWVVMTGHDPLRSAGAAVGHACTDELPPPPLCGACMHW